MSRSDRVRTALIVADVQKDFCPGGALPVPRGDEVVDFINGIMSRYDLVVAIQDWHPPNHLSFASSHPGRKVYEIIDLDGLPQCLWPDHCVQETRGAELHHDLNQSHIRGVVRKGTDPSIDSYSAFFDNGYRAGTGLEKMLREGGIGAVDLAGLATDYCVKATALDARKLDYPVRVFLDGCRGIDLKPGDIDRAVEEMKRFGVVMA